MVSPFIVVFLYEYMDDLNMQTLDLPKDFEDRFTDQIELNIEADTYHCFCRLMNNIKDNYTQGFPGVVKEMDRMKNLIGKLDQGQNEHFEYSCIDYHEFAFRWILGVMIREFGPLYLAIMYCNFM